MSKFWSQDSARLQTPKKEPLSWQTNNINKQMMMSLTLPRKDLLAGSSSSAPSLPPLCSSDGWFRRLTLGFRATGGGSGLLPPAASLLMVLLECES